MRCEGVDSGLYLIYAAIRQHGVPTALVTDSGGVFLANHAQRIYAALGIRKAEIARRQAWQSLIETNFGVQMRMADYHFAKAATWADLLRVHEQWMTDFNAQMHWAHRQRKDGQHSPDDVLDGARGATVEEEALRRIFFRLRVGRVLDARGYARLRHWKVYGERGLAGRPVGLWLYGPQLTIEHRDEPLAQFHVAYAPGKRRLKAVTLLRLFETPFRSPQPWLFPLDDDQWHKAFQVAAYAARRHPPTPAATQLPLFPAQMLDAVSS